MTTYLLKLENGLFSYPPLFDAPADRLGESVIWVKLIPQKLKCMVKISGDSIYCSVLGI